MQPKEAKLKPRNKMTEKNYAPTKLNKKAQKVIADVEKGAKPETPVQKETKAEEVKEEKKKTIVKKEIVKKDEAVVNGISLPVSTKDAMAICKFIKKKSIDKALADLNDVTHFKKVIPMTGEIPHKKGKGIMSGRYPIRAIEYFVTMLKTLKANANVNGVEEPIISEAVPNKASQPFGRGGIRRKRTHVKIKVVEKNKLKNKKKK